VSIWLRTGDGRLPMPVPHLGTLYLTVSRTLILLCKPSNATWSTFSALEVSYKKALYKSTVIMHPYHSLNLHPGPCSSVGMWRGTDRQTHRRPWVIYISPRLCVISFLLMLSGCFVVVLITQRLLHVRQTTHIDQLIDWRLASTQVTRGTFRALSHWAVWHAACSASHSR